MNASIYPQFNDPVMMSEFMKKGEQIAKELYKNDLRQCNEAMHHLPVIA
jgi:hypothetical protein